MLLSWDFSAFGDVSRTCVHLPGKGVSRGKFRPFRDQQVLFGGEDLEEEEACSHGFRAVNSIPSEMLPLLLPLLSIKLPPLKLLLPPQ